ncbi:MAG: glycosyltransferase [Leptolyngbyaceae cyanobacterium SL_7_1]|nr:glycosyltransferase [Leptolyngbyaceae cyanobacterium SL_7_1]
MTHHILIYSDDHGVGGVAQYNHMVALSLSQRGYRVTSVQSQSNNPLVNEQQQQGIHHEWLPFDSITEFGQTVTNAKAARSIFSHTQPDLIVFSDCCPLSNMAAKQVALQLDIPYLIVIGYVAPSFAEYFQEQPQPEIYLQMLSRYYDRAKAVVAVSQENLDLLHKRFGLAPIGDR